MYIYNLCLYVFMYGWIITWLKGTLKTITAIVPGVRTDNQPEGTYWTHYCSCASNSNVDDGGDCKGGDNDDDVNDDDDDDDDDDDNDDVNDDDGYDGYDSDDIKLMIMILIEDHYHHQNVFFPYNLCRCSANKQKDFF